MNSLLKIYGCSYLTESTNQTISKRRIFVGLHRNANKMWSIKQRFINWFRSILLMTFTRPTNPTTISVRFSRDQHIVSVLQGSYLWRSDLKVRNPNLHQSSILRTANASANVPYCWTHFMKTLGIAEPPRLTFFLVTQIGTLIYFSVFSLWHQRLLSKRQHCFKLFRKAFLRMEYSWLIAFYHESRRSLLARFSAWGTARNWKKPCWESRYSSEQRIFF